MATHNLQPQAPLPVPVTPSAEDWQKMSRSEREQFIQAVNEALSDPLITMSEGRPHKKAKSRAIDMLSLHFRAMGRRIYLAEELSVLYPNTTGFTPDVLAILDVEEPEDDQRMAWVVQDEGKGLDWVLEVLWAGDRKKDLVDNVEKYAMLGIPEYFVYDQRQQRLLGYRLSGETKRYQPIVGQAGLYRSNILGIDLAIVNGTLRFYQGTAELYDTAHLIRRLETMIANLEARADQAIREVEMGRAGMRKAMLSLLSLRGIVLTPEACARLEACSDNEQLDRWLARALVVTSEAELFAPANG